MARKKIKKSCSVQQITFKTKRGRTISFKGRSKGQEECGKKARKVTTNQRKMRKLISAAGKTCAKKARPGTATNKACIIREFKTFRAKGKIPKRAA